MRNFFFFATLVFLLTIFLRIYKIDEKFVFHAEFNYKLWPVKEIIYDKKIRLIGIEAVSYLHHLHYPPLALYIFAPILYLSGANPLSIEIALIFLNGITAVLIFYLGAKLFGYNAGLLASLIYATSFFVQRSDRFIWVVGAIIFFTVIYLIAVNKIINQKKINLVSFFLLGAIVGLALNFHFQAGTFFLVSIMLVLIYYPIKNALKLSAVFIVGVLLLISPILIFELRHDFYNLHGIILLIKDSSEPVQSSLLSQIYKSISSVSIMPLKIINSNINGQSINKIFIFISFGLQLLQVAFFLKYRKKINRNAQVFLTAIILLWLFGLLSFPFVQNKYYSTGYYLYFLIPIYIFGFGYSLNKIAGFHKFGKIVIVLLISIFALHNLNLNNNFVVNPNWRMQNEALDYIFKNHQGKKLGVKFISFPSEEYAFLFYYKSKIYKFPYESIEFIEPWQGDNNYDFIFLNGKEVYPNSRKFGNILIGKKN